MGKQAVVQVNEKHLEAFMIERSVRQGCPPSPPLYVLVLEPLLRMLEDEKANPARRRIPFAGPLSAKVYAYADDIIVFMSGCEEGGFLVRTNSKSQGQL